MADLALKYRPQTWDEVLGQDAVVASIKAVLKKRTKRAFLLTGISGCGKTTISRIIASEFGCSSNNILEVDGATSTGIDAMREVASVLHYQGFGDSPKRAVIVDESHAISRQAFQSLLKPIEEPPAHVVWILCTTEPGKIPKTIKTRCASFDLSPVRPDVLRELLERVVEGEGFSTPDDVLRVIVKQAYGSPRQALSYLAQCYACKSAQEALPLLKRVDEEGEAIELARAIAHGGLTWAKVVKLLEPLREQSPEGIRLMVLDYFTKVAMGKTQDKAARYALSVLDAFSTPCNQAEGFAPLLLAFGRLIFGYD